MEKAEAELGVANEVAEELTWTKVDLVLDEICKNLSVAELKKVRLVNKTFCAAASKFLARKTLVRLTGLLDLRPAAEKVPVLISHCSLDADYYFECQCDLEAPKEYIRIESYLEERAEFDSGLVVKNVSVVSSSDVWLLAILPEFSRLEELQVVTFRPSEGLRILVEFPLLFPNLKKLELKYIQPDVEPGESGATDWTWTSMAIEDEQKKVAETQLEELAITVSAYWTFVGSSVFERFRKLKALKLLWCGDLPNGEDEHIRYNQDGELFGGWLLGPSFHSEFPMLTDMSLRFDLTPGNLIGAGELLNKMKLLQNVSLELYGHDFEVSRFILSLQPHIVAALTKVHWAIVEHNMWDSVQEITPALTWLGNHGFFSKSEWTFRIQEAGIILGVLSFVKTKTQLTHQRSNTAYAYFNDTIYSQFTQLFSQFNYAVRRYCFDFGVVRYESEQFGLVDPFFNGSEFKSGRNCEAVGTRLWPSEYAFYDEWHRRMRSGMRGKDCQCTNVCRKPTPLLCEVPGFLQDARILFHQEHPAYYRYVVTDVFCWLLPNVLEKYTHLRSLYSQEPLLGHGT